MEKQEYTFNLSLKQMIFRRIAIDLWQQADVLELVNSFNFRSFACDDTIQEWQKSIENVVKEKASVLSLPGLLKGKLMEVIKPVGPEILKWKLHLQSLIPYPYFALDQLCWTCVGTVDYQKTAEILIKQERINILSRYKLACIYCMESEIRSIWEKLSEQNKKLFYYEDILLVRPGELVTFWTYFIKGEVTRFDDFINGIEHRPRRSHFQYAFEFAARSGNKIATEYFFQLLTLEERQASLLETTQSVIENRCFDRYKSSQDFPKEKFSDVVCYLLSQMKEEDQIRVFQNHPYKTSLCFMDWPWQHLFTRVVGLMWDFLPDHKYESLLMILANNRTMTGYNYTKLFRDFFLRAPSRFKTYLINKHQRDGFWFCDLIYSGNTTNIELVLRSIDEKDRQIFITCDTGYYLCWKLIEEGKWFLLERFVSECTLSSETKRILKNGFKFYLTDFNREGEIKWSKLKCERFFQLIDNVNDANQKIVEEAEKEEQLMRNKQKR